MYQAGTFVFIATFAVGTILSLLQPLEAPASTQASLASLSDGQSAAVVTTESASESAQLTVLTSTKIASFEEKNKFVGAIRLDTAAPQENKATLASAKPFGKAQGEPQVQGIVLTHPAAEEATDSAETQPVIQEASVAVQPTIIAEQDQSAYALNPDKLFDLVNGHRTSIGLVAVQRDDRLMAIARERAPELFDEIFVNGNMHAGFNTREASLPYFATENMIYYNNEEGALNWWLNSAVHRGTIQNPTYTHAGIACEGKSCAMIYSAFVPK